MFAQELDTLLLKNVQTICVFWIIIYLKIFENRIDQLINCAKIDKVKKF